MKILKLPLLTFTMCFLLTSCSFNKLFLEPTKIPVSTKKMTLRSLDTTVIHFFGPTHQPTYLKSNLDTIHLFYTIESVMYLTTNGDTLNGWFLKPKNQKPSITLLHLHGNAGCMAGHLPAMDSLLKFSFQIFMFDYSGFGFSSGRATRENVLTDALYSLDYIKAREDVKNTKLIIYGQSLGGHLAAVVAEKRQKDIDALVIEGAFSSHKDIGAYTIPILGRLFVKQGYSAHTSIKKFQKPLLVIHSAEDEVVPFYMGKKIFNTANTSKEFYEIKQCHICGPSFYSSEISNKIKKMVN